MFFKWIICCEVPPPPTFRSTPKTPSLFGPPLRLGHGYTWLAINNI
jgi:hypothetical protein